MLDPKVFKAYDVRGIHPTELDEDGAYRIGRAYVEHALQNPAFYEVMFSCPAPEFEPSPEDAAFAWGTFQTNIDGAQRCIDAGLFAGDAVEIATAMWAVSHGVASLALGAMIPMAEAHPTHERLCDALMLGLRTAAAA